MNCESVASDTRKPLKKRNFESVILLDQDPSDDEDNDQDNHVSILEAWTVVPSSDEKSSVLSSSEIATLPGDDFFSTSPLTNDFNTQIDDQPNDETNDNTTRCVENERETTQNAFSLKLTKVSKNLKEPIDPKRQQKQTKKTKPPAEDLMANRKRRSSRENAVLQPLSENNCNEKCTKKQCINGAKNEAENTPLSKVESSKKKGKNKKQKQATGQVNAASEIDQKAAKEMDKTVISNPPRKKERTKKNVEKEVAVVKSVNETETTNVALEQKINANKTQTTTGTDSATKVDPDKSSGVQKPRQKKMTFEEQVFNHMLGAFKPFTLKSLAKELHTTDTILKYTMLSLTDKGIVVKKDFGKNKELFWTNQQEGRGGGTKEIRVIPSASADERLAKQKEMLELQNQVDAIKSQMELVLQQPSNSQLETKIQHARARLREERSKLAEIKARIANQKSKSSYRNGNSQKAASKENCSSPRRLKLRINALRNEWKIRKEKVIDFIDLVADGMEKKPKDIYKLLDIETDEDANVAMPPKHMDVVNAK
jgi:hypothetical protein